MTADLRLSQQLQLHVHFSSVRRVLLAPEGGHFHIHLALPLLGGARRLNDLREGHGLMAGGQSTSRLLKEEIELYLPLENKLGADELALCTHRLDPSRQKHWRLPGTGLEPHLVRECKGFFLYGAQQVILSLVLLLAEVFCPAVGHAAAHRPFRRLTGRDIYRKVHPQQHLPGVEDPGLGAAQPGAGQHRSPLGQAGGLRLTGEGQPHLHPPQAAAPLGLVENHCPHHAGNLGSALPGLLAAQSRLTAHIHNAQDIRAGIGYDAL